jgi:hypothetical protein
MRTKLGADMRTKLELDAARQEFHENNETKRKINDRLLKERAEERAEVKKFKEDVAGAFAGLLAAVPCKVNVRNRRVEFSYKDTKYWLMLDKEWRTASNEGEDDDYHKIYALREAALDWRHRYFVCDWFATTTWVDKGGPYGTTKVKNQYPAVLSALRGNTHEIVR